MSDDLIATMAATLTEMGRNEYNEYDFEGILHPDIKKVDQVILGERRWGNDALDIYQRQSDGAVGGVLWYKPATEVQEGQPTGAAAVQVESYVETRTTWRTVP